MNKWDLLPNDKVRFETTPTGVIIEYRKNDHGGEDVIVHLPMLDSGSDVQTFVQEEKE